MTSESLHPVSGPGRRTMVAAVGATGLAVALTACGGSKDTSSRATGTPMDPAATGGSSSTPSGDGSTGGDSAVSGSGGTVLAKTSDIPEGGGKVFSEQGVVVTQPSAGTFKAFSSKCTHQGCAVKDVSDGMIICPCHDSEFSATDGSVQKGPARQALPAAKIMVSGSDIKLV
ncbi:Rieske 2Fe-2S domain-containing protein [Streptomyces sp. NPDC052040]|uniref:Rieske (2Fe-2S) protein n=1 Tax=unclassified Streptomyces TaxID=2593676 RepID=UPI0037CDB01F